MALYNNNNDANKTLKNVFGRTVLFAIMAIISFFISVHLFSEKAKVIIRADIEVEREKLDVHTAGVKNILDKVYAAVDNSVTEEDA